MIRLFLIMSILTGIACNPRRASFSASDEAAIRHVLANQEQAWNSFALEAFMAGYWKSDSLKFIGSGVTRGWQATLERYQKSYPTREAMGKLTFTILSVAGISSDAALVTGRYTLERTNDRPTGLFTLVFRKIEGKWVIVYDHTG